MATHVLSKRSQGAGKAEKSATKVVNNGKQTRKSKKSQRAAKGKEAKSAPKSAKKAMARGGGKKAANVAPKPRKKSHCFSEGEKELISVEVSGGMGHKAIYKKYVSGARNGKKRWGFAGVKKLVAKLKDTGSASRKKGSGRPRKVTVPSVVKAVMSHVSENPSAAHSSVRKIKRKFKLSRGTAVRILRKELDLKALRKVKQTRLSDKNKRDRLAFCRKVIDGARKGTLDLSSVFFTDESMFRNGSRVQNQHNNYVNVPRNAKKKDLPNEIIVSHADNSNLHVMIALGVSKMGIAGPFFIPAGTKLNGEKYGELLEQQYFPAMGALAHKAGKSGKWSFQQDNAPAHKPAFIDKIIKKHAGLFMGCWPACSPDLAPLDYFVFNEIKSFISNMDAPPKKEAELRTAICLACAALDQEKINKAIDSLVKRCEKCIELDGLRFEHKL